MLISSLQRLLQNQNLETFLICIVVPCFPHQTRHSFVTCFCPFRYRTNDFVHRPIRVNFRHFTTICYETADNSPTDPFSSSLNWWSPCMALLHCIIAQLFYSPIRNFFPRISLHDLPCHKTMKISFRHQVSPWLLFLTIFCSPGRYSWFEHTSVIVDNIPANLTFFLSTTQMSMVKEWCWSSQIDVHENFPSRIDVLFLSSQLCYRPHITDKSSSFSRLTNKHSQFGTFSQPCINSSISNCLLHNCPAKGWP